jgi:acetylornithine deacetylase/succinyl-diaminopimelate desuccinylase-like protein
LYKNKNMVKTMKLLRWFVFVAIVIACKAVCAQISESPQSLTANQKMAREILKELIEINTTVNAGSTKAAEAMAVRLKAAGFPEEDIQLVGAEPQHMNLVVRYRGKGIHAPILFIGHLDVVEALQQDWSFAPFKFLESGGYFYGRGTTDMKHDDASLVAGLIRLKQEQFVPNRDIIVALTEGEESGVANGVQWLLANRRNLIDAEYCINPDAGGGDLKKGTASILAIQTSEKVYLDYQLEVHNKGGHSSLPVKENAIYRLAEALTRISKLRFPIKLNETTRLNFERSAIKETGQTREDMLAAAKIPTDLAAAERLAEVSPIYNSQMRTTCVATVLKGGHANNALPQSAQAIVNCRMLPDDKPDDVLAAIQAAIADEQVEVSSVYSSTASPVSPLRKDVLETLDRLAASMWPGVTVVPAMSTGASDAKPLRAAGIPVYGISGMFGDPNDIRAHGKDERIGVREFYQGVEFMYQFIKALTLIS